MSKPLCPLFETCTYHGNTPECLTLHSEVAPRFTSCSLFAQENVKAKTESEKQTALAHSQRIEEGKGLGLTEAEKRKREAHERQGFSQVVTREYLAGHEPIEWSKPQPKPKDENLIAKLRKVLGSESEKTEES